MKKRLLAMFLTVAMIISMLPVMVFAGGETGGTGEVLPNIMDFFILVLTVCLK